MFNTCLGMLKLPNSSNIIIRTILVVGWYCFGISRGISHDLIDLVKNSLKSELEQRKPLMKEEQFQFCENHTLPTVWSDETFEKTIRPKMDRKLTLLTLQNTQSHTSSTLMDRWFLEAFLTTGITHSLQKEITTIQTTVSCFWGIHWNSLLRSFWMAHSVFNMTMAPNYPEIFKMLQRNQCSALTKSK